MSRTIWLSIGTLISIYCVVAMMGTLSVGRIDLFIQCSISLLVTVGSMVLGGPDE